MRTGACQPRARPSQRAASWGTDGDDPQGSLDAVQLWESLVGVWEAHGEIVGVATIEHPVTWHPGYGDIFVQRLPEHVSPLLEAVQRRGYVRNEERSSSHLEYAIGELPAPELPPGFSVRTMTQERDVDRRREIFGRSFNHEDPREWPSAFAYRGS